MSIIGISLLLAWPAVGQVQVPTALPDSLDTAAEIEDLPPAIALEPPEPNFWSTGVSPTGTVLMTPLFPGWGQLYTDNSWRGALAFGLEMFYWSNMLVRDRRAVRAKEFSHTFEPGNPNRARYDSIAQEDWEQMRDFAWWSGGVLFIIALDAYVGAHLFNFDEDVVPVPNDWEGQFSSPGGGQPIQSEGPTIVVFQHGWRF